MAHVVLNDFLEPDDRPVGLRMRLDMIHQFDDFFHHVIQLRADAMSGEILSLRRPIIAGAQSHATET